jgi:hypothetical protein
MFKSKGLEKDQNAAANAAELVGRKMQSNIRWLNSPRRGESRPQMWGHALASAPVDPPPG